MSPWQAHPLLLALVLAVPGRSGSPVKLSSVASKHNSVFAQLFPKATDSSAEATPPQQQQQQQQQPQRGPLASQPGTGALQGEAGGYMSSPPADSTRQSSLCAPGSWASPTADEASDYVRAATPTVHTEFHHPTVAAVRSLDELLLSTVADDNRRRVDFGLQPQQGAVTKTGHHNHCVAPDGTQLLDGLGVLTRTTHALLRNDGVIVDCNGPMLHASTQRPDQTPSDITRKAHALQWLTVTPADHNHMLDEISSTQQQPDGSAAAASSDPTALQVTGNLGRHFRWGFDMRYSRSSNYQMFMVVCLSRWWYLMRLVEAHKRLLEGDAQLQGQFPGPNDTVAVFVTAETAETAATRGGSAVNAKDYVINTIRLLSMCKSAS
jgi:hypothetical protein